MTETKRYREMRKWRALVRSLRIGFPISGKVKVSRRPCKKWSGSCRMKANGNFSIYINSNHDWSGQVDALIHEWAHMVAMERAFEHGDDWGKLYSELYRFIIDE